MQLQLSPFCGVQRHPTAAPGSSSMCEALVVMLIGWLPSVGGYGGDEALKAFALGNLMHQFLSCMLARAKATEHAPEQNPQCGKQLACSLRGSEVPPPTLGFMPPSARTPQNGHGVFLLPPLLPLLSLFIFHLS